MNTCLTSVRSTLRITDGEKRKNNKKIENEIRKQFHIREWKVQMMINTHSESFTLGAKN
jgi:hypothetical protein